VRPGLLMPEGERDDSGSHSGSSGSGIEMLAGVWSAPDKNAGGCNEWEAVELLLAGHGANRF
jgi:hypothetical protein